MASRSEIVAEIKSLLDRPSSRRGPFVITDQELKKIK